MDAITEEDMSPSPTKGKGKSDAYTRRMERTHTVITEATAEGMQAVLKQRESWLGSILWMNDEYSVNLTKIERRSGDEGYAGSVEIGMQLQVRLRVRVHHNDSRMSDRCDSHESKITASILCVVCSP